MGRRSSAFCVARARGSADASAAQRKRVERRVRMGFKWGILIWASWSWILGYDVGSRIDFFASRIPNHPLQYGCCFANRIIRILGMMGYAEPWTIPNYQEQTDQKRATTWIIPSIGVCTLTDSLWMVCYCVVIVDPTVPHSTERWGWNNPTWGILSGHTSGHNKVNVLSLGGWETSQQEVWVPPRIPEIYCNKIMTISPVSMIFIMFVYITLHYVALHSIISHCITHGHTHICII